MLKRNEQGTVTPFLIPFVIVLLMALGLGGFGFWAFTQYQDYKNDSDAKSAEAVAQAEAALTEKLEADFAEREKSPNQTYQSPSDLGSVRIVYPKTWSAYVNEKKTGSIQLDGYFHPNFVPGTSSNNNDALRVTIEEKNYSQVLKGYDNDLKQGKVTSSAVSVSGVQGVRLDGELEKDINGAMVLFPIRDKTLKVWTESRDFLGDFNGVILSNLSFVP